jgi:hypothetical protein
MRDRVAVPETPLSTFGARTVCDVVAHLVEDGPDLCRELLR